MGPGRSLAVLASAYQSRPELRPPTRQLSRLKTWSATFAWQDRVAAQDKTAADAAAAAFTAERQKALETGFAQLHKRVASLVELAELLQGEILEEDKRWLPDVKSIGAGVTAERVDLVRFNAPLIEQFRGALGDIAAELGGRVKGLEITGAGGGPLAVSIIEVVVPEIEESDDPEPKPEPNDPSPTGA